MIIRQLIAFFLCLTVITISKYVTAQEINKEFLLGKYDYTLDTSFKKVPYTYSRGTVFLKKQVLQAFLKMRESAKKEGVTLEVISGTRSFYDQREKWELKWNSARFSGIKNSKAKANTLLRWWSMPGTSRHHWGTDIDLNNMKLAYYKSAAGIKMYDWMIRNASKFGFYQPFNANRSTGYQQEKWHWSYVPLSKIYLSEYIRQIKYEDLKGFSGSNKAEELDVIKNWITAVNPACK